MTDAPTTKTEILSALEELFDAERSVRRMHDELLEIASDKLLVALSAAVQDALPNDDDDERSLRLVRIADLLGELEGPKVIDLLIDILGCEGPEARRAAGEVLQDIAYERFKEVALGVERALTRLPEGHLALTELPYLLAEVPEGGVPKLLGRFLAHADPEAVASAIQTLVELGEASAIALIEPLKKDTRRVRIEEEDDEVAEVTIGELAREGIELLANVEGGNGVHPKG